MENEIQVQTTSLFFDVVKFEHAQRVAKMLTSSSMVPEQFRGETNIGNCLIALNMAERMGGDPFMLMQNMYVVSGKPGLEAKYAIACFNFSGRFSAIKYVFSGEDDGLACVASAKNLKTGDIISGECSIDIAKKEKWIEKNGSKWKTMPKLMLQYRSAMFMIRTNCPEVILGMHSTDELRESDMINITPHGEIAPQTPQAKTIGTDIYAKRNQIDPAEKEKAPGNPETVKQSYQVVGKYPGLKDMLPRISDNDLQPMYSGAWKLNEKEIRQITFGICDLNALTAADMRFILHSLNVILNKMDEESAG